MIAWIEDYSHAFSLAELAKLVVLSKLCQKIFYPILINKISTTTISRRVIEHVNSAETATYLCENYPEMALACGNIIKTNSRDRRYYTDWSHLQHCHENPRLSYIVLGWSIVKPRECIEKFATMWPDAKITLGKVPVLFEHYKRRNWRIFNIETIQCLVRDGYFGMHPDRLDVVMRYAIEKRSPELLETALQMCDRIRSFNDDDPSLPNSKNLMLLSVSHTTHHAFIKLLAPFYLRPGFILTPPGAETMIRGSYYDPYYNPDGPELGSKKAIKRIKKKISGLKRTMYPGNRDGVSFQISHLEKVMGLHQSVIASKTLRPER